MADRTVNGNTNTENGWRLVDTGSCVWVKVPGANVTLQIREGQPAAIMGAFAADFNAYVEPLRDADSACYTESNSVLGEPGKNNGSNHMSATAMDLNWNSHPFRVADAGFDAAKKATVTELLNWYEDMIFWGNNWNSPKDAMHFQMGYDTYGSENVDRVQDFINRKVRADGFSTFRRSGTAPPPPVVVAPPAPASNAADVLARATGITLAKASAVLPLVSFALGKGNCTNPRRIAAALAQWVIESGHFVYTEEIADGPETEERWKYKGRTWVQLTWLENYRGFSVWCHSLGLVPTPDYFVVRPRELADQKWAALGPAYWWAVKYPRINEYADRGDIDNVSKWVNAPAWVDKPDKHANHEKERRDAYNQALALGDQLLVLTTSAPPTQGEGFLMSLSDSEQREVLDYLRWLAAPGTGEFRKKFESRSAVREPGEGAVDTITGMELNSDGNIDFLATYLRAQLKYTPALDRLKRVAAGSDPGRPGLDALLAQAMLAESSKKPVQTVVATSAATPPPMVFAPGPVPAAPLPVPDAGELIAAYAEIARLRQENARLQAAVSTPIEPTYLPAVPEAPGEGTLGKRVGKFIDAVGELDLSAAADINERVTLAASIKVLASKNGTEL